MICLNPQLHVWWGKAYFGFECLGVVYGPSGGDSIIQLRLHWLPKAVQQWKRNERDEDALRKYLLLRRSGELRRH
ncbi:hypothetical protein GGS23DRAFT_548717 [Durotheca rogersii]|uniref:uncharacterized protein n=1 Tax=Durotheca rogersii TaxID=419775 RepID=UPI00221F4A93|nr:uncharacterized protein GGS23DRAFT_548717 [Durotheca rogersii]KAI5867512.1 hypothetical protein GGS23DRAFT_548717 [Durotheca rogersii]